MRVSDTFRPHSLMTDSSWYQSFKEISLDGEQGLSQQGVWVSFWHPGPRKIPIFGGKDTLSFGQSFLKI